MINNQHLQRGAKWFLEGIKSPSLSVYLAPLWRSRNSTASLCVNDMYLQPTCVGSDQWNLRVPVWPRYPRGYMFSAGQVLAQVKDCPSCTQKSSGSLCYPSLPKTLWVGVCGSPEKAFRGSKNLLTRYLEDFGSLGLGVLGGGNVLWLFLKQGYFLKVAEITSFWVVQTWSLFFEVCEAF